MLGFNLFKGPLVLLGFACIICVSEGRSTMRDWDTDEDYVEVRRRRDDEVLPKDVQWLGLGVLSDMQQFFDNLRTNLDSLDSMEPEERDALQGKPSAYQEKDLYIRPAATAAYLNAIRNQRPSYKIRNFVESPEPATLRGTNHYDPSLLWTGLGRRKR
uniref:Uncharacterized protein n=1 Tax=Clastoptera arizonana TaxID=38151 RepID=A0A1B6E7B7_9HEMI